MPETTVQPLPAYLSAAVQRLAVTAERVSERSAESLGLAALSAAQALQRDRLQQAQVALERNAGPLHAAFLAALQGQVAHEIRSRQRTAVDAATHWDALTLVDDQELETQVAAERLGMTIGQGCEWELRELDSYLMPLLRRTMPEQNWVRSPIRPETLGQAILRAIDSLRLDREPRKLLESELARTWQALLPQAYAAIVAELRSSGHTPATLGIRPAPVGAPSTAGPLSGAPAASQLSSEADGPQTLRGSLQAAEATAAPAVGHSGSGFRLDRAASSAPSLGRVDPGFMALMRRLATQADAAAAERPSPALPDLPPIGPEAPGLVGATPQPLPNLIQTHRHELLQASSRAIDRTVIDVVGSLFEQILSDPALPAAIAQQIGRLQLPVLRAAIGDNRFFASQRHPVRQLVNRVASLGTALDGLALQAAEQLVQKVRELVQGIVEGDFDRVSVYEAQLDALERFVSDHGRDTLDAGSESTRLLADREHEWRLQRRYSRQLAGGLSDIPAPDFVREFVAETWSQAIVRASLRDGVDSVDVRRLRQAGQDLLLSILPKGTPDQRKAFVAGLPRLMQDLTHGMDLVAWPQDARKAFFGQLLPAHARSLKGEAMRTLDLNLLSRQVERLLQAPLPTPGEPGTSTSEPMPLETAATLLSPAEAQSVGLLSEEAIDWSAPLDIDLSDEAPVQACDLVIEGLPAPEPPEPTRGSALADHVKLGLAYQMHLEGQWQKVRLNHVSPARSFFVFSRGRRHQQVISLTRRMLVRLCDSDRFRAFENAYLLERATARARRQLAALGKGAPAG